MAEIFNFSTPVGSNWTIPTAYYEGMSQSPTAGAISVGAGALREFGSKVEQYAKERQQQRERDASTSGLLSAYEGAGIDTSTLKRYMEPIEGESRGETLARREAVIRTFPLWVELQQRKQAENAEIGRAHV